MANKLFYLDRHVKIRCQQRNETVAVAYLAAEQASEEEFGKIAYVITSAELVPGHAFKRADVDGKPVLTWPVQANSGTRLRPCSIKEEKKTMVEHIEKTHESSISRVDHPPTPVLRKVQREGTVGAKKTKKPDFDAPRLTFGRRIARRKCGRRKRH